MNRLPLNSDGATPVDLTPLQTPRFLVTVDTEEEFDWSAPFSRAGYGTTHIPSTTRFQSMCARRGVSPLYLIDYPIATDPASIDFLGGFAAEGKAEIGLQLHPWVNPPFDEEISRHNSFTCNLPVAVQHAKIEALHRTIVENFGVKPDVYRAGRYGIGADSLDKLGQLGIRIDSSVRPLFDYSNEGGPNFNDAPLVPYWLAGKAMLELPLTSVFSGSLRSGGRALFGKAFSAMVSRGLLARLGLLERIALTPEGIPVEKAVKAIDIALDDGVPILNFSFHSPSLAPGHTPYVRNSEDLEQFYWWWGLVFDHLERRGVRPVTAREIAEVSFPR